MNIDEALELLSEDVLGDLKRKLKGQVSRADTILRVAKQELKSALTRVETLEEIVLPDLDRETSPQVVKKITALFSQTKKELAKAQKDLDKIK